jgi:type I restriction enzyme S subunit
MRAPWIDKPVGEVLRLEYGKPLNDADRKPDGRYPVYGANGEKDRTDKFYFDKPSIIVGRKGSAGEVNLTEPKFWPLDVTYFVTFDDSQHELRFLYYLLTTLNLPSLARGVKPGINRNEVYSQVTRIPPLPEQRRIVAILDEAFEGIATVEANADRNRQNARALFDSHLQVESAEKALLRDLVNISTGKLDANAAVEEGEYPFFTCSRDTFAINTYAFDCEAILLAGNNAVGDFNVKHYKGRFNAYQRTYVITVNEQKRVLPRFLYFQMLKSLKKFKAQSVGAGTKFLKLGMIRDLEIALPSLDEQRRIVLAMDSIREQTERLESIYERKLAALEALKKSLIHQAFTGQL